MVNELRRLLRESAAASPPDPGDLAPVLRGGRRRVRRRRLAVAGGTALATAAVVGGASLAWPGPPDLEAAGVPRPEGPVLRLVDAEDAEQGRDYRVLASHTEENLDRDNGRYFDGVTDDGLVLFRDGPRMDRLRPTFTLLDPATGERDRLPDPDLGQAQTWPLELGADRLVLLAAEGGVRVELVAHVFDRSARAWTTVRWPGLPRVDAPTADLGPDGRVYVAVPAARGRVPEGGWPMVDGEAEDADAEGDTYALWSASLTDPADVRDEGLLVGEVAFTDRTMVWTDRTNGDAGRVHVRDLRTGEETSFDPRSGERCNLLGFGATSDRVVLGQYCGTYDGVRDDRVQVLTAAGDPVVTVQDDSVEGHLAGDHLVTVTSHQRGRAGTFVYDLRTGRLLRLTDSVSRFALGGPTPGSLLLWDTAVNRGKGAQQWLGEVPGR